MVNTVSKTQSTDRLRNKPILKTIVELLKYKSEAKLQEVIDYSGKQPLTVLHTLNRNRDKIRISVPTGAIHGLNFVVGSLTNREEIEDFIKNEPWYVIKNEPSYALSEDGENGLQYCINNYPIAKLLSDKGLKFAVTKVESDSCYWVSWGSPAHAQAFRIEHGVKYFSRDQMEIYAEDLWEED